jgi:hypothetical protein
MTMRRPAGAGSPSPTPSPTSLPPTSPAPVGSTTSSAPPPTEKLLRRIHQLVTNPAWNANEIRVAIGVITEPGALTANGEIKRLAMNAEQLGARFGISRGTALNVMKKLAAIGLATLDYDTLYVDTQGRVFHERRPDTEPRRHSWVEVFMSRFLDENLPAPPRTDYDNTQCKKAEAKTKQAAQTEADLAQARADLAQAQDLIARLTCPECGTSGRLNLMCQECGAILERSTDPGSEFPSQSPPCEAISPQIEPLTPMDDADWIVLAGRMDANDDACCQAELSHQPAGSPECEFPSHSSDEAQTPPLPPAASEFPTEILPPVMEGNSDSVPSSTLSARLSSIEPFSLEEVAVWLLRRVGVKQWLTRQRRTTGDGKYQPVSHSPNIQAYLHGDPGHVYGSRPALAGGQTWFISYDIDPDDQASLDTAQQFCRELAEAGVRSLLAQRRLQSYRLEIHCDAPVNALALHHLVISTIPSLAGHCDEVYPVTPGGHWKNLRDHNYGWPFFWLDGDLEAAPGQAQAIECPLSFFGEWGEIHTTGWASDQAQVCRGLALVLNAAGVVPPAAPGPAREGRQSVARGGVRASAPSVSGGGCYGGSLVQGAIAWWVDTHTEEDVFRGIEWNDRGFCAIRDDDDTPSLRRIQGKTKLYYDYGTKETLDLFEVFCRLERVNKRAILWADDGVVNQYLVSQGKPPRDWSRSGVVAGSVKSVVLPQGQVASAQRVSSNPGEVMERVGVVAGGNGDGRWRLADWCLGYAGGDDAEAMQAAYKCALVELERVVLDVGRDKVAALDEALTQGQTTGDGAMFWDALVEAHAAVEHADRERARLRQGVLFNMLGAAGPARFAAGDQLG